MGNAELLELLIKARSTAHIDGILRGLRVVDPEEYFFDPHGNPSVKWKPGCLHWVPVGRDRGNSGRIKLAGEPTGPIAERSINGMEAIIELERLLELLKRPTAPMPSTPRAAVLRYFGLPRLEDVPAMDREERRTMRDRINAVRKKLEVHLKKRTRPVYNWQLRTIDKAVGERVISSLAGKDFRLWYNQFKRPTEPGGTEHIPKAHGLITMVRALVSFGVQWRVPDAATLRGVLSEMKFQNAPAREEFVTYEMALAFIAKAHELGEHNMAFAQALQFDLTLRQTDVIGTWEPKDDDPTILEPVSGLCWQHIDRGLILKYTPGKTEGTTHQKVKFALKEYALVMAELERLPVRPSIGPMIINPKTSLPYKYHIYVRLWRKIATAAEIPVEVWNRDSRAGGVTEGGDAGAALEDLGQHAGHARLETTRRYNRKTVAKTTRVAKLRAEYRNNL